MVQIRSHNKVANAPSSNKHQSAYKKQHSTETAILKILNDVGQNADTKRATLLIGLDLSAAFDTIDHSILFKRLQLSYGLHGQALNWVISYLEGRNQYIKSGDSCSDQIPVTDGVPQGSVLGPLLFSLYISPVADVIGSFGMSHHQYADDTQLYIAISSSDYRIKMDITESCLHAVQKWFTVNYLALNPDKTEAILLGTRQQTQSSEQQIQHVNVAGEEIKLLKNLKTLGVILDENLSFATHVQSVSRACHYHIRALKHIRPLLTSDSAVVVACGIVGSRLDYCNSLLYGTSVDNLSRLQRVQNTLARVVTKSGWRAHSLPILERLHWLPVEHRIRFKIATLTFRALHQNNPPYLHDLISRYTPARTLRSTDKYLY